MNKVSRTFLHWSPPVPLSRENLLWEVFIKFKYSPTFSAKDVQIQLKLPFSSPCSYHSWVTFSFWIKSSWTLLEGLTFVQLEFFWNILSWVFATFMSQNFYNRLLLLLRQNKTFPLDTLPAPSSKSNNLSDSWCWLYNDDNGGDDDYADSYSWLI